MSNKNYLKGRRKEYKICNIYKNNNWDIVQRSAGSHSSIDLFAINKKKRIIKLIQVKPDKFNPDKILKELNWLNGNFKVEFEVV